MEICGSLLGARKAGASPHPAYKLPRRRRTLPLSVLFLVKEVLSMKSEMGFRKVKDG